MFRVREKTEDKLVLEWEAEVMDYMDLNDCIGFILTSKGVDVRILSEKHGITLSSDKGRLKITIEVIE